MRTKALYAEKRKLEHTATMAFLALRRELTPFERARALRVQTQCETRIAQIDAEILAMVAEDRRALEQGAAR
jgi:hypothetical protein